MSSLAFIAILVAGALAVAWSIYDFFGNAQRFIAPDIADRDTINAKYGEGTPEAQAALRKRFGAGSHRRDAATGLGGLVGILILIWIWFG